jgi:carboxypeptidase family protein
MTQTGESTMKRSKTSTSVLIASLIMCAAFVAGLVIVSQTVMAAATPIPGIGVIVKKTPGGGTANARTGDDGKFTIRSLETGSYTMTMKVIEDYPSPRKFKTAVIMIEGVRGGTLIKRVPLTELRGGVTLEIKIVGRVLGTITGTCMATDEER